jgi:DNA-binding NtrC family response regulator
VLILKGWGLRHAKGGNGIMKKILVVGKDPKMCEHLRKYFDPQEYILLSSYDPKNTIASTINLKPDLVILDLNLSDLKTQNSYHSGIEVLRKLKESNSNLPVIAIADPKDQNSDSSSNLTQMGMIRENVYAWVKRPIQPEKLSSMVKEALSRGMSRIVYTTVTTGGTQKETKDVPKFPGVSENPEKPRIDGLAEFTIDCEKTVEGASTKGKNYHHLFDQLLTPLFDKIVVDSKGNIYDHLISGLERCLLSLTLKHCHQNQVKSSQILGISRNTLRERIKRYDLW